MCYVPGTLGRVDSKAGSMQRLTTGVNSQLQTAAGARVSTAAMSMLCIGR